MVVALRMTARARIISHAAIALKLLADEGRIHPPTLAAINIFVTHICNTSGAVAASAEKGR